jgi:Family of unknown function (DUF5709)
MPARPPPVRLAFRRAGYEAVVSDDPQDLAEALDEDKADDIDDLSGDAFGDDLPDFPPDRPMGVNTVGVTAVEEDAGESFAERTLREEPDVIEELDLEDDDDELDLLDDEGSEIDVGSEVGQLVEPDASSLDHEAQQIAEAEGGEILSAEEAAMHIEEA